MSKLIFTNGADPYALFWGGKYYYTHTTGGDVCVWSTDDIHGVESSPHIVAWTSAGTAFRDIWAPELHFLNGKWYIYFAADENGDNALHRMYVLEAADPLGPYTFKGKIADPAKDVWAIDGTVLEHNGKLWFIWSGWENAHDEHHQYLFCAPMANPLALAGPRVKICSPTLAWERGGDFGVNEGPQILKKNDKVFVVYSANGSWTDHYCLGLLELKAGGVPNDPNAWIKHPNPAFCSANDVFGPGHCSFLRVRGVDQIVYHAAKRSGAGWDRNVRIQNFTWGDGDHPNFGAPICPH